MPGSEKAEIYFIAAMMVLILVVSFAAVYLFFRQYKKERAGKVPDKQIKPDTDRRDGEKVETDA